MLATLPRLALRPLLPLGLVALGLGCRPLPRQAGSGVLHDSRGGLRARPSKLADCHALAPDAIGFLAGRTPKADGYLRQVAEGLIGANPDYFRPPYEPSRFCYAVAAAGAALPSAFAQYDTGQIVFDLQFVMALKSSEQVAAVLAHELAHVVMNHGAKADEVRLWTSTMPIPEPPAAGAPAAVVKAWRAEFTQWTEREADEVGYDMYREAGLPRAAYRQMITSIFALESPPGDAALAACERDFVKASPPREPPRGTAEHPSTCWRLYDFDVLERRLHERAQAEQDRRVGADRQVETKISLAEAQAEVQAVIDAVVGGKL
jgi:hypothetical protein